MSAQLTTRVVTSFINPPIPLRDFDWCAYYDGHEEYATGYGPTEDAAISDLTENYEEPGE